MRISNNPSQDFKTPGLYPVTLTNSLILMGSTKMSSSLGEKEDLVDTEEEEKEEKEEKDEEGDQMEKADMDKNDSDKRNVKEDKQKIDCGANVGPVRKLGHLELRRKGAVPQDVPQADVRKQQEKASGQQTDATEYGSQVLREKKLLTRSTVSQGSVNRLVSQQESQQQQAGWSRLGGNTRGNCDWTRPQQTAECDRPRGKSGSSRKLLAAIPPNNQQPAWQLVHQQQLVGSGDAVRKRRLERLAATGDKENRRVTVEQRLRPGRMSWPGQPRYLTDVGWVKEGGWVVNWAKPNQLNHGLASPGNCPLHNRSADSKRNISKPHLTGRKSMTDFGANSGHVTSAAVSHRFSVPTVSFTKERQESEHAKLVLSQAVSEIPCKRVQFRDLVSPDEMSQTQESNENIYESIGGSSSSETDSSETEASDTDSSDNDNHREEEEPAVISSCQLPHSSQEGESIRANCDPIANELNEEIVASHQLLVSEEEDLSDSLSRIALFRSLSKGRRKYLQTYSGTGWDWEEHSERVQPGNKNMDVDINNQSSKKMIPCDDVHVMQNMAAPLTASDHNLLIADWTRDDSDCDRGCSNCCSSNSSSSCSSCSAVSCNNCGSSSSGLESCSVTDSRDLEADRTADNCRQMSSVTGSHGKAIGEPGRGGGEAGGDEVEGAVGEEREEGLFRRKLLGVSFSLPGQAICKLSFPQKQTETHKQQTDVNQTKGRRQPVKFPLLKTFKTRVQNFFKCSSLHAMTASRN